MPNGCRIVVCDLMEILSKIFYDLLETERRNFFAIEGTGLLTAEVYEATASSFVLSKNTELSNQENIFPINSIADICPALFEYLQTQ